LNPKLIEGTEVLIGVYKKIWSRFFWFSTWRAKDHIK